LIKHAARLYSSTGDQHVKAAIVGEHPVDQSLDGGFVGDITPVAGHPSPGLSRQIGSGLLTTADRPAGQHYVRARRRQRGRDPQAKPSRPAGHKRYLTSA
jgi:hypothetical protein